MDTIDRRNPDRDCGPGPTPDKGGCPERLQDERGCGAHTRNQRLSAIRAFASFVASHDPAHVAWRGQVSAIASKKTTSKPVAWLTVDEMHALLDVPDRTTRHGRIEHAILLFLSKTGARVSEATQLRVGDLQVGRRDGGHALVTLHGKGGKIRLCPLRPDIERVLIELIDGHCLTIIRMKRVSLVLRKEESLFFLYSNTTSKPFLGVRGRLRLPV